MSSDDVWMNGDPGVEYVLANLNKLLAHHTVMRYGDNTKREETKKTEGADVEIKAYREHTEKLAEWADMGGLHWSDFIRGDTDVHVIEKVLYGSIEIKLREYEQFLARNDNLWPCGAIQFAIWNSNPGEPKRMKLGSLYRMCYPKNAQKERQPVIYIEILNRQNKTPFAGVVFEDFSSLKDRIITVGGKYGLDLTERGFSEIPCRKDYRDRSPDEWAASKMREHPGLKLVQNMWHVPFSEVADLATITMIGEPVSTVQGFNGCSKELQDQRLEYLMQKSNGRHIPYNMEYPSPEDRMRRHRIYDELRKWIHLLPDETGEE